MSDKQPSLSSAMSPSKLDSIVIILSFPLFLSYNLLCMFLFYFRYCLCYLCLYGVFLVLFGFDKVFLELVGVILVLVLQKVNSFWITWLRGLELDHHLCLHTMDMDGIKILRVWNWKQPQFHVYLLLIQ